MQASNDTGIYAEEDGGFLMIDDDINPGLRSGVPTSNAGSGYSARDMERHTQQAQVRQENFPSLAAAAPATNAPAPNGTAKKPPPAPSKSLMKITKVVKKTSPAEIAKQKKAREEAQRKAQLSQLNFFDPINNAQPVNAHNGLLTAPTP
jgi:hypothetical protein